jgi:hypothetical protein
LLLGIAAVFTGLRTLAKLGNMDSDKWYWIQIAVLGAIGLVWLTLLLVRCATGGRSKGKDAPASHSSLNGHGRAGGGELGVGPNGHRSSGSDSMRKAQGARLVIRFSVDSRTACSAFFCLRCYLLLLLRNVPFVLLHDSCTKRLPVVYMILLCTFYKYLYTH